MSLRLFDFTCVNGHTTEHFTNPDVREVICPECEAKAKRIISPVRAVFKGTGFPTADDKWAARHEKAAKLH